MGWRPWEIKRTSIADFMSSIKGWRRAQGIKEEMTPEETAELRKELFHD